MKERNRLLSAAYIITGTLALMCLGLGYGWSVFRGAFGAMYPAWSQAQLSFVFSTSMICFGVGSFVCGLLLKKLKPLPVLFIGMAVLCGGFFAVSLLGGSPEGTYPLLLLFYGILGGGGIGICYNMINSSIPKYFLPVKGTVSGVMMAGYGSGALILGALASSLIARPEVGLLRTFRILSAVELGALLLYALLLASMERSGSAAARKTAAGDWGYRPGQVLRLPSFWILQIRNILSYAACLIIIEQAGVLAGAFGMAAIAGLIVSVANGLSRIPSGILCDRIGCVRTLRLGNGALLGAVALLWLLTRMQTPALFFLCFILFGLSYGMTPPVSVSINEEFFGPAHRAVNYAFFSFTLAPASIAGPTLLGVLRDLFGDGVGLTAAVVSVYALLAFALSFCIRKPAKP